MGAVLTRDPSLPGKTTGGESHRNDDDGCNEALIRSICVCWKERWHRRRSSSKHARVFIPNTTLHASERAQHRLNPPSAPGRLYQVAACP
mmetsp:Transcript_19413/g.44356  ORF Transcript_19413/g.44356 Transcript_19413/m.44356 type:complete len:90 (+) Transcript_19413:221-490(+)